MFITAKYKRSLDRGRKKARLKNKKTTLQQKDTNFSALPRPNVAKSPISIVYHKTVCTDEKVERPVRSTRLFSDTLFDHHQQVGVERKNPDFAKINENWILGAQNDFEVNCTALDSTSLEGPLTIDEIGIVEDICSVEHKADISAKIYPS